MQEPHSVVQQPSQASLSFDAETIVSLEALHDAYRQGRKRRGMEDGQAKADERWRGRLKSSARDQAPRSKCVYYITKARESAQREDTIESCRMFGVAHALLVTQDLSDEGKLLVQLELAAAEAYLDYCCGDFDLARARLIESMSAAQELEDRFRQVYVHIHRVHLINNMAKLEGKAGNLLRAMELAAIAILYLQTKSVKVPFPGSWDPRLVQQLPLDAIRFLSGQTVGEIASLLVGLDPSRIREALQVFTSRVDVHEHHESWKPEALDWLQLKVLCAQQEIAAYLNGCIPYFAKGPGAATVLWHLTAMDAAVVCEKIYGRSAEALKHEVLTDLGTMSFLPRHLKVLRQRVLVPRGGLEPPRLF